MSEPREVYTYISHARNEYPVHVISRHEYYVDIEFLEENLTMLDVIKYKIKEIAQAEGNLNG